ncbi:MAG: TIM barrel protein [Chloroflexi bacterium]|nr:TIM barrel protein [Chloroflexota bacterium]
MTYPTVYLAIDNCFASKRRTAPGDWARVVRDLGLRYVEASADTEIDPLYTTAAYRRDWVRQVRQAERETGVRVANLYSGHGTYATLGLAHPDARIRDHMQHGWLDRMAGVAGQLPAGLGFFCHAFPEAVLHDGVAYEAARADLIRRLAEVARRAAEVGIRYAGVEQMYTPHQMPWRIAEAEELLRQVYAQSGKPFYLTLDVGHACAQRRFTRPTREFMRRALRRARAGERVSGLWLGPQMAYAAFEAAAQNGSGDEEEALDAIEREMARCPHLFAAWSDGDPYAWLSRLAAYSPIIHLQQTPGNVSAHLPFTERQNAAGIIRGERVLRAIAQAYEAPAAEGLPPRCEALYLTLEVFSGTADIPADLLGDIRESVDYWRRFIPQDGLPLDELLAGCVGG